MGEIERYTEQRLERFKQALIRGLQVIGERCVNKARMDGNYTDQTGNLRSSIGYVISVDGNVSFMSNFIPVKGGDYGIRKGKKFARKLAKEFPQGICLIVVAGMEYAAHVSAKGYDVLDGSELLADRLTDRLLRKLGLNH
ncbi:hypothetical protein EVA_15940 [gut metagenome]|uniref:Uncharacterized protein n=1 Tax=gut metagenome TaxID=749906 RepID=J9G915_9ZZZZ